MEANGEDKNPVVRYVPDEICVVVEWGEGVACETERGARARLYREVGTEVDSRLRRALAQPGGLRIVPQDSVFAVDLQLPELQRLVPPGVGRNRPLLEFLDEDFRDVPRPEDFDNADLDEDDLDALGAQDASAAAPEAWVVLPPNVERGTWRSLYFYGIAAGGGAGRRRGETAVVRELTNLINIGDDLLGLSRRVTERGWWIVGATPNWRLAGGPDDETTPGPGALPDRAGRVLSGNFHFGVAATAAADGGTGKDVAVAVLDTSPTKKRVSKAATSFGANHLLQAVSTRVDIDGPLSVPPRYFLRRNLAQAVANWRTPFPRPPIKGGRKRYKMPDHGLFAAGIIQSIAPEAEVHLIRVLGDLGVGTVRILTSTLSRLPGALLKRPEQRLVVNLSLMADLPPGVSLTAAPKRGTLPPSVEFMSYWFPRTSANERWADEEQIAAILRQRANENVGRGIKLTHVSLQSVVEWLGATAPNGRAQSGEDHRQRILCVAAAGNDALGQQQPPRTRLPARYDSVLGVASVTRAGAPSSFSNRGDEEDMGDGVAVPGGNAKTQANGGAPVIDREFVTGIYSRATLPFGGPRNRNGWVRWAGTSFAAPIVSGLAARIWSTEANCGFSPRQVITTITAAKTADSVELACPWIETYQEP